MINLDFDTDLKSLSSFYIEAKDITCYCVENPVTCEDFTHMHNKHVLIDGKPFIVKAIEFSAHSPPYFAGETISIAVKSVALQ